MSGANGSCRACRWFDETEDVREAPQPNHREGTIYYPTIPGVHLCKFLPKPEKKHEDDWCGQFEAMGKA